MESKYALRLRGICKSFGNHEVLHNVSVDVPFRTAIAVCGPSGCGKSTLLNIVGLLEGFDGGTYELLGKPVPKHNSHAAQLMLRDEISYLFQNFALVANESAEDNIDMALHYVKLTKKQRRQSIAQALDLVGLDGSQKKLVCELSGGEQQRVAIARCMVKPGNIVLADEPTGSLDETNRDMVVTLLLKMRDAGKAVFVVTHDSTVAESCDSRLLLG